jgi:hypothetical protein
MCGGKGRKQELMWCSDAKYIAMCNHSSGFEIIFKSKAGFQFIPREVNITGHMRVSPD